MHPGIYLSFRFCVAARVFSVEFQESLFGALFLKIRFGQARERKQLQWRESFNVFSGVGFRCGSKREKRMWSQWCHTRLARSSLPINFRI